MANAYRFHIERLVEGIDKWIKVGLGPHKRMYCDGYIDALDGMYPSAPYRIVRENDDGSKTVVRETKGRGPVHLN